MLVGFQLFTQLLLFRAEVFKQGVQFVDAVVIPGSERGKLRFQFRDFVFQGLVLRLQAGDGLLFFLGEGLDVGLCGGDAFAQRRAGGDKLLAGGLRLGKALFQLRQRLGKRFLLVEHAALFNLGYAFGYGGLLGRQFGLRGVQLGIGFRLGAFQLTFRGVQLGAAVVVLGAGVAQLGLAVGKQLFVDGDLAAAGNQFVAGVAQFALGLVALGEIVGVCLVKFGSAVAQFRQRVVQQRFKALVCPRLARIGHLAFILLHAGLVFVGIDHAFGVQAHVDFGVVVAIKTLVGNIGKAHYRAVAQRSAAALVVHVCGGIAKADDGIFAIGEHIQRILVVGVGDAHSFADAVYGKKRSVAHHLVRIVGQTAGGEADFVDALRQRVKGQHAGGVRALHLHQRVLAHRTRGGGHALNGCKSLGVALVEAEGGNQAVIIHVLAVQIIVAGFNHSVATHAQAAKKAYAKGDDRQNRQIPPQAFADFPHRTFLQRLHITTRSPRPARCCR